jgi:hypothetical protein
LNKISQTFSLLFRNPTIFIAIVLTIWLPLEVLLGLVNLLVPNLPDSTEIALSSLTATIFLPHTIGAVLHTVFRMQREQTVSYAEAMSAGVDNWGRLFSVRFQSGLYAFLGFLLFFIPGIVLSLGYSFIEGIVVHEKTLSRSLGKSWEMTKGKRWEIFLVQFVYWFIAFIVTFAMILIGTLIAGEDNLLVNVLVALFIDFTILGSSVINALFYWEQVCLEAS